MIDKAWSILIEIIKEYNEGVEREDQLSLTKSTVLFGDASPVDSMSLVNIVLNYEDQLMDEFNSEISLSDDIALEQEISPYNTLGTLHNYAAAQLKKNS